jgi:site-specific recombinase XerD
MNDLTVIPTSDEGTDLVPSPSLEQARAYARHSKADNTLRAYESDWRDFCGWCDKNRLQAVPASPDAVAAYIAECSRRLKVASIQQRLAAITEAHRAVNLDSPTSSGIVKNTMKGIRRQLGIAPAQKQAAVTADICQMLDKADAGLIGLRDRALILIGFSGAFRRSEIVALNMPDLCFDQDGLAITLRRSKTDQEGRGRKVGIPYTPNPAHCAIRVLEAWIEQAGVTEGPVFRSISRHGKVQGRLSGIDVARVVKKLIERAGLNPAKYAGHSLRSGHVTSAVRAGASLNEIMDQTGHRSAEMVRRYIREGDLFRNNSAAKLGL